ncbi:MAG: class I SAM-dependent methyltransferase [Nitrospira sp.]
MEDDSTRSIGACRICRRELRFEVIDLGLSPLCESLVAPAQVSQGEFFYPLRIYVCEGCFLVQVTGDVNPGGIFTSDYPYFSSWSDSWLSQSRAYTDVVVQRFRLTTRSQIIEIGSNDGYLLQYFQRRNIPVLGIEPAGAVASAAIAMGIETIREFFSVRVARRLCEQGRQADLLIANNVLAQVPNPEDFVAGLKLLLKPSGVVTIEFPHVLNLIENNQFDTMYHEHYSYFSFRSAETLLSAHGFTVFDVEELPSHGGSLRILAGHQDDKTKVESGRVTALRVKESRAGVATLDFYRDFSSRVGNARLKLLLFLMEQKRAGKSVVGYGAPGKGNALLNYCGVRTDFLGYTVDRNPVKHGKLTPGSRIPIFPIEKIRETKPDYLLVLPWNLREEIMRQMAYIRSWGGQFVVPIPEVQVIS